MDSIKIQGCGRRHISLFLVSDDKIGLNIFHDDGRLTDHIVLAEYDIDPLIEALQTLKNQIKENKKED